MELRRRKFGAGFFLQAEEGHDLARALSEDEILVTRQNRYGARSERLQLCEAGGVGKDIDGNEVDPTDR